MALALASCGGGAATTTLRPTATTEAPPTSAEPTTTAATTVTSSTTSAPSRGTNPDLAAFCRATGEVNAVLVLSAFGSLAGPGAQDLYVLSNTPELVAASAEMVRTAPAEYAEQAATVAALYAAVEELAAARGLGPADLEALAIDIEAETLTADELLAALGITPDDLAGLFADAAASLGDREPPLDLLGADLTAIGCAPDAPVRGACDLLGDAELIPLVGDPYSKEASDIGGFGEQCTIRGDGPVFVDVVLGGPTFYLPSAWNEIEMVSGLGDEAFLTPGLTYPFLYVKQDDVVISLSVANTQLTTGELTELVRIALGNATG